MAKVALWKFSVLDIRSWWVTRLNTFLKSELKYSSFRSLVSPLRWSGVAQWASRSRNQAGVWLVTSL